MKRSTQIWILLLAAAVAGWYFLLYRPSRLANATGAGPATAPRASGSAAGSAPAAKPAPATVATSSTAPRASGGGGGGSNGSGLSANIDLTKAVQSLFDLTAKGIKALAEFMGWSKTETAKEATSYDQYATDHGFSPEAVANMRAQGMNNAEIKSASDSLTALELDQVNNPPNNFNDGAVNAGEAPALDGGTPEAMQELVDAYNGGWDGSGWDSPDPGEGGWDGEGWDPSLGDGGWGSDEGFISDWGDER